MKNPLLAAALSAGLVVVPMAVSANVASVRLANDSVRMLPGDCSCGFGLTWIMYFSSFYTEEPSQANGELAPQAQPADFAYWTYLVLEDPSMYASATFAELNLPLTADANGNGIPAFFDVDEAVSAQTTGRYVIIWEPGYGELQLTWDRPAGSRFGSCQLYMDDSILGLMGPFEHAFELVEFSGSLTYIPSPDPITGSIRLAKAGAAAESLEGPVALIRSATDRFNRLTLVGGQWTGPSTTLSYSDSLVARNSFQPSVYRGTLQGSADAYPHWKLTITDPNDANGNGIPDLSDDVATAPPRRPALSLTLAGTNLLISLRGDIGHTHWLQEAATPNATNWNTIHTIVLTNDPQGVTIPWPAASPAYWRVQAW